MKELLFCPLRKKWVSALPEEKVRQELIQKMIHRLGYPPGGIVLEKNLDQMPHLQLQPKTTFPKRRADLIVFAQGIHPEHPYYPLLLIECKAVALTEEVLRQIVGYNQFIRAPFIGAVNQTHAYFGYFHGGNKDYQFENDLPPYNFLLHLVLKKLSAIKNPSCHELGFQEWVRKNYK